MERLTNDMKKKERERRRAAKEEPVTVEPAEEPQPVEEHPAEAVQMSLL